MHSISRLLPLLLAILHSHLTTNAAALPEGEGHLVRVSMDGEDEIANTTNIEARSTNIHGYQWQRDCTGDYYIWTGVSSGCYTYWTNGVQDRMYSIYLEGGCVVHFFNKNNCGDGDDWIDSINWDKGGCRGALSGGFMSFHASC